MKVSIIIPTYKRPDYLERCIESLLKQERPAEELIVVTRQDDLDSINVIAKCKKKKSSITQIKHVLVSKLDIVFAENQGLRAAIGDIVCFIDDDAIALGNWIRDIVKHYERDSKIGGVGGPVIPVIKGKPVIEYTETFSKINWYGKRITNSAKIPKKLQEVDALRGCNMSFKRELIGSFDENLLPYWRRFEDDICLSVKERGYKILCDPDIKVYHYEADIQAGSSKDDTPETIIGLHHNSIYVKLKHFRGVRRIIFVLYEFIWGDDTSPGVIPFLICAIKYRDRHKLYVCLYAIIGKMKGVWTYVHIRAASLDRREKRQ